MAVRVPGYERFENIGKGGFSEVYKAYQPEFQREVAIKVLNLNQLSSLDGDAFRRECQAIGAVSNHPNIVTVYGSGVTDDGRPFIAMELCRDESLHGMLRRRQVVSVRRTLTIGAGVADALALAHDKNILHRDIKPQNILFSEVTGLPALADFGIAYQTADGTQHQPQGLTVQYAAPEVIEEEAPTAQADIYSLGATLYTALAGRRPFHDERRKSVDELIERILHSPVPPIARPGVPPVVEQLVVDMMAKDPARRPASAREVGRRVRDIQHRLGMAVTPSALPDDLGGDLTEQTLDRHRPGGAPPAVTDDASAATRGRNETTWAPDGSAPVGSRPLVEPSPAPAAFSPGARRPEGRSDAADDPGAAAAEAVADDRSLTSATVARPPGARRPVVDAPSADTPAGEGPAPGERAGRGRLLIAAGAGVVVVAALAVGVLLSPGGEDEPAATTRLAAPSTTELVDRTPPAAPADVAFGTGADGSITIEWSEVERAASYRVIFVNGGLETLATEDTEVQLPAGQAPDQVDLCVEILAVGAEGQAGDASPITCR
ncbi:MAG: protein kinase [Actinomycetota bacterium]